MPFRHRNLSEKQTHAQLVRKHSVTVVAARWATVDWSWPKKWSSCAQADLHLKKKKKINSAIEEWMAVNHPPKSSQARKKPPQTPPPGRKIDWGLSSTTGKSAFSEFCRVGAFDFIFQNSLRKENIQTIVCDWVNFGLPDMTFALDMQLTSD